MGALAGESDRHPQSINCHIAMLYSGNSKKCNAHGQQP